MRIRQSAAKSWEYLVGVYLGDGCVMMHVAKRRTKEYRYLVFRLNTIDEDFAAATKEALRVHTEKGISISCHPVSKSSKPNYALMCMDAVISQRLRDETDSKAKLPDWIWTADQAGRLAFIAGLMDSEGFVSRRVGKRNSLFHMGFKSTDPWFFDFIRVLNMAGIKVGTVGVEIPLKPGYKTPRRFTVKMATWIQSGAYFNIARKQAKVDEWASQLSSETNTRDAA